MSSPFVACAGKTADDGRMKDAGFQIGQMKEGRGGAWTDYTFGVATAWRGVKA